MRTPAGTECSNYYEDFNILFRTVERRALSAEKETLYRGLYRKKVKPVKGLLRFLKELKKNGCRLIVATMSPEKNKKFVLDRLRITKLFDAVLSGRDVKRGKPHPDIFQLAARKAGLKPALLFYGTTRRKRNSLSRVVP